MEDCIFCKIVENKSPCWKVYEDDSYLAFLPLEPHARGHVLVIPKKHYRWVWDVDDTSGYFKISKKIANALRKVYNPFFVMGLQHGDGVSHAHIHLIPRFKDDGHGSVLNPNLKLSLSDKEKKEIVDKIKEVL